MLIGVMGGFFVVPLNALLQERGKKASGRGMRLQYKTLAKQRHVVDAGHLLAGGNDRHPGRAHWHWLRCAVCAGNNGAVDLAAPSLIFNAGFNRR